MATNIWLGETRAHTSEINDASNRDYMTFWQYSGNMRGQQWSVEATAPNGILLKHADGRSIQVPSTYMNSGTFLPIEIANKQIFDTDAAKTIASLRKE